MKRKSKKDTVRVWIGVTRRARLEKVAVIYRAQFAREKMNMLWPDDESLIESLIQTAIDDYCREWEQFEDRKMAMAAALAYKPQ